MKKREKILAAILIAVLVGAGICFDATVVNAATPPEYLTIGIKYGSSAVASGTISSTDSLLLGTLSGGSFTQISELGGNKSVSFKAEGDKILLSAPDGTSLAEITSDATYILYPLRYDVDWPISFSGTGYRGGIILKPVAGNKAAVHNYIKTEQYLEGMLHAEMPQSAHLEALKAQAVAARSFAYIKQNIHQADGFNLCASNHCQVYTGVSGEYLKTSQAVHETEGLMMYANDAVVEAYYFKNSGGHTNNSEDVWTATLPYLRAVKDSYEPAYPWTASFSTAEFGTKLQAAGFSVGNVKSVQVKSRSVSGNVLELEVIGSAGNAVLKKEQIRSVLGTAVVKSLKFNFNGTSQTVTNSAGLVLAGAQKKETTSGEVYVLDSSGTSVKTGLSEITMFNGTEKLKYGSRNTSPFTSGSENADLSQGTVLFTGSGYGHGVGMSQDGAMEMGTKGKTFEEILKFYYTGIEIKDAH